MFDFVLLVEAVIRYIRQNNTTIFYICLFFEMMPSMNHLRKSNHITQYNTMYWIHTPPISGLTSNEMIRKNAKAEQFSPSVFHQNILFSIFCCRNIHRIKSECFDMIVWRAVSVWIGAVKKWKCSRQELEPHIILNPFWMTHPSIWIQIFSPMHWSIGVVIIDMPPNVWTMNWKINLVWRRKRKFDIVSPIMIILKKNMVGISQDILRVFFCHIKCNTNLSCPCTPLQIGLTTGSWRFVLWLVFSS